MGDGIKVEGDNTATVGFSFEAGLVNIANKDRYNRDVVIRNNNIALQVGWNF